MAASFDFGDFQLDAEEHRLLRAGHPVPLPPKAFDLLLDLVRHAGHLREKKALMDALWPGTFVEEVNLAYTVSALRKALGDERGDPKYVETVPTKGYRFVAQLNGSTPTVAVPVECPAGVPATKRRSTRGVVSVATVLAGAMLFVVGLLVGRAGRSPQATREAAPVQVIRSTFEIPEAAAPVRFDTNGRPSTGRTEVAFSPDGSRLAWTGQASNEAERVLYVTALADGIPKRIPGTEGASQPLFSPDGRWIAFLANNKLCKVPLGGGLVSILADTTAYGEVMGGSWTIEPTIVLGTNASGLLAVPATGGAVQIITTPDRTRETGHRLPFMLPGGRAALFTSRPHPWGLRATVEVVRLDTRARAVLVEDCADARYLPTRHLVCVRRGTVLLAPFDLERLELSGPPVPVVGGVLQALNTGGGNTDSGAAQMTISGSGLLAYVPGGPYQDAPDELVVADETGRAEPLEGFEPRPLAQIRFSPDGRRVAFTERAASGLLWVFDIERHAAMPLSHDGIAGFPIWTPDGRYVATSWSRAGSTHLWLIPTDGTSGWIELTDRSPDGSAWSPDGRNFPASFTPDGRILAFERGDRVALYDMAARTVIASLPHRTKAPEFSPDGHWLAYTSMGEGRLEVYVTSVPDLAQTFIVSTDCGDDPVWTRDWRLVFACDDISEVSVRMTPPTLQFTAPRRLFSCAWTGGGPIRPWDMRSDGRMFLFKRPVVPHPAVPPVTRLELVHNWFEEIRALHRAGAN